MGHSLDVSCLCFESTAIKVDDNFDCADSYRLAVSLGILRDAASDAGISDGLCATHFPANAEGSGVMRRMIMLGFVCLVIAAPVQAGQKIIQIGGGNKIDNSQGQIEDNVIWLSEILNKSSSDIVNYFASGEGDEKDVSLYDTSGVSSSMEVISRVFEDGDANRLVFKHNDVPGLSGGTNKKELTKSITSVLENVASEQEILLIFNGHGGHDRRDERNNTLKIWGDERLNVSEVDKILDHAPDKSTIRFIFPQCYSGGFYYLIFDDPSSDRLSSQNRCGFFAESAMEESEGCSLNTNRDEYRDYSNY